jgi:hypothetical protein
MTDKATSLFLTNLIAPGYLPGFLASPLQVARDALDGVGRFDLVEIVYGVDFKGLFGQEQVPYGVVARSASGGQLFCAIRGTDSVKEWLEDGWAVPEPWPFASAGVRTHKGFTDLYETLTVGVTKLSDYLRPHTPIVTGHSLGAALANLLAADLGPDCLSCTTFEGPRVGDLAFTQWMDAHVPSFFRYVIIGDVVPHAPPENLGYFHAGTEIDMDPSGVIPLTLDPLKYLADHHVLASVQKLLLA